MKFNKFVKDLHIGTVGFYPLYWAVRGTNIVFTTGKTGTNTLKHYSDYTSDTGTINLYNLLESVYKKNFKIHILIREPNSRFKSGIFQELSLLLVKNAVPSPKAPKLDVTNIKKWTDTEWISNLENFISEYIDILKKENKTKNQNKVEIEENNFHIGNWLYLVNYIQLLFPNEKIKIWEYTDFNKLLSYLDCDVDDDITINKSENKPFLKEYNNAYSNLSENIRNKICQYLDDEVKIWNELINLNKKYVSVFDREPIYSEIPTKTTNSDNTEINKDEIPNEETDKT